MLKTLESKAGSDNDLVLGLSWRDPQQKEHESQEPFWALDQAGHEVKAAKNALRVRARGLRHYLTADIFLPGRYFCVFSPED